MISKTVVVVFAVLACLASIAVAMGENGRYMGFTPTPESGQKETARRLTILQGANGRYVGNTFTPTPYVDYTFTPTPYLGKPFKPFTPTPYVEKPFKPERRQKEIARRLTSAEDDLKHENKKLAVATTVLEELEKQKVSEKISDATPIEQLTRLQKTIIDKILKANAKKEDLTVKSAVSKVLVEELKKILVANGGSADKSEDNNINSAKIRNKIAIWQEKQKKTNEALAAVTKQLEELEKDTENKNQRKIESAKEKKYQLTVDSAVAKTEIEQLQLLLPTTGATGGTSEKTA